MKTTQDYKQKMLAHSVLMIGCLSAILGLVGCQDEGSAEKAGKKIDRAIEKTSQNIGQATENAGQKIEGAKESVIEKAETTGEYIDDSVITLTVKAAILNDPMLNASHIEVTTVNGEVKLSGTVDNEKNIGRSVAVARSQEHVKSVQADLAIKVDGQRP